MPPGYRTRYVYNNTDDNKCNDKTNNNNDDDDDNNRTHSSTITLRGDALHGHPRVHESRLICHTGFQARSNPTHRVVCSQWCC